MTAAIVVADINSGAIRASIGTADWTGTETLMAYRPASFGGWQPLSFDNVFRGTLSIRQALILSLNIPVVRVAAALGPARIVQALDWADVSLMVPDGAPGLAVVPGGAGVTLQDLAQAYAALAWGGAGVTLSALAGQGARTGAVMFGSVAAWQVSHTLSQPPPNGAVAGMNGQSPAALRRFVPLGEVSAPEVVATDPLQMISPPDGAEIEAVDLRVPVRCVAVSRPM